MSHAHDHGHAHGLEGANARRLGIALALAASYMLAEVIGGVWTGSLALLADAGHMLSDVAALGLAIAAIWLTRQPASSRRTFGYHRADVVAALINASALLVIGVLVVVEAVERWSSPPEVVAGPMVAIAFGGLVINVAALLILRGGREESLNVKGAFLHVMADALGSVGAMTSGALIWAFDWRWADPLASFVIAGLVVFSALLLLRQSLAVLMESAPAGLDVDAVRTALQTNDGVVGVHDLHVWALSSGKDLLIAHVVLQDEASWTKTLPELQQRLLEEFELRHVTLQPELQADGACRCAFC